MPSRSAKRKPVTLDEIESFLDLVAVRMDKLGPQRAELYLPIWRALEREREKRIEASAILAAAKARLTRSLDRTAALSS